MCKKAIKFASRMAIIFLLVFASLLLCAWGPGRPIYDLDDDTSGLVCFNSLVDENIVTS
jgi:hypothetical protein